MMHSQARYNRGVMSLSGTRPSTAFLRHPSVQPARKGAFTLLELLVVIAIVSLLLAILLPALGAGRDAAHDLRCRANMRSTLIEFQSFADTSGAGTRGDSDQLGSCYFRIEEFQEKMYGIDEFWSSPGQDRTQLDPDEQRMMCPSAPSFLERRSSMPCSSGAVAPFENVSVGFNRRLHVRTVMIDGHPYGRGAYLTDQILMHPNVPLLLDVDGKEATCRAVLPYYSAPPIDSKSGDDIYSSGTFWFPAKRHRGRVNIGFVGGHVLSSHAPLDEPGVDWKYQTDGP